MYKRSIIRDMKDLWDVYRLVKFIASDEYKKAELHQRHRDRNVENLYDLYIAKTSKPRERVEEIYSRAGREKPQYIEETMLHAGDAGSRGFRTTGDGRDLIELHGWGLFRALVHQNWPAVVALGVIITTVIFNVLLWIHKEVPII